MDEALLEPLLRQLRLRRVLPYVRRYPGCELLDIGCGWDARLLRALEPFIAQGVGVDRKAPVLDSGKLRTFQAPLASTLPFGDRSFDVVTMLAVLEHLDDPESILREAARVLKPNGALLLTVPSRNAKPLLELLAFRLGIVSKEEIADHKRYFDRGDLLELLARVPSLEVRRHRYFQAGFNNFLHAIRKDGAACLD